MTTTGRYAPSPTGVLHLGNLRTALLAWVLARKDGGRFVLRFEDLDGRCRQEYYDQQLRHLEALGLDWDGPVLKQSEHLERYRATLAELVKRGLTYPCFCSRKDLSQVVSAPHLPPGCYPGTCRDLSAGDVAEKTAQFAKQNRTPALRLKSDTSEGSFVDAHYGPQTGAIDDFVLARSDQVFSYNFVCVIDDLYQGVNQIVRGNDLIPSTPRQIYLTELLGGKPMHYAHAPMILNAAGVRLSKRDASITLPDLGECGWQAKDVLRLLASSLGVSEVESSADFLARFEAENMPREDWHLDTDALAAGPCSLVAATAS